MILRWGKRWKHADTAWESFVTTQLKQLKLLNNTMQSCWGRSYKGPGVGKDTQLWSKYRYLKCSTSHSRAIASLIEIPIWTKCQKYTNWNWYLAKYIHDIINSKLTDFETLIRLLFWKHFPQKVINLGKHYLIITRHTHLWYSIATLLYAW